MSFDSQLLLFFRAKGLNCVYVYRNPEKREAKEITRVFSEEIETLDLNDDDVGGGEKHGSRNWITEYEGKADIQYCGLRFLTTFILSSFRFFKKKQAFRQRKGFI